MSTDRYGDSDSDPDPGRPGDAGRSREPAPDKPSPEPPEIREAAAKPAESRTRQEHADHIPPQAADPEFDANPASQTTGETDRPEANQPKEEQPSQISPGERQEGEQPRISDHSSESSDRPHSPDGSLTELAESRADKSTATDAEPQEVLNVIESYSGADTEAAPYEDHTTSGKRNDVFSEPNKDFSGVEDRPQPLTDEEWAEHLDEVRDGLDKARADGLRTSRLHTIDGKGQIWSEERDQLHDSIIEDFCERAVDVPCNFKAIIAGGLGGAGKTTVLTTQAGIDISQYLMLNPDDFKEELARRGMIPEIVGLSPMEASDLAHEESSYLAKRLARRAQAEGKNLIWDITMASRDSTEERIRNLHEAGYKRLDGLFVDIPVEVSIRRTDSRHREGHEKYRVGDGLGGRFVPPEVVRNQADEEWSSQNRRIYDEVKEKLTDWSIYDNSVDGRSAALVDSKQRRHG
jgi:Zeta toxin